MRTIPLTNSDQTATVSDIDYERAMQYRWMLKHNGHGGHYVARSVRRKSHVTTIHLHRFIMQPDDGYDVHHIHGDKLDCRRSELELIEHSLHSFMYYGAEAKAFNEWQEQQYG